MTPAEVKGEEDTQVVPDFVIESMARCLLPQVQAYYARPEGQAAYAAWKQKQGQEHT